MSKKILYNEQAQKALKRGIDIVANAIKITIGPRGRNVVLDHGYGSPLVTNDGATIAKEISLADKFENMGAEIMKEVANKTNEIAGDGTTTSVILAQALMNEGLKKISMGVNPMGVRLGIEDAIKDAVISLKKMAKPIKTDTEIKQIATISAESEEIGEIIGDTIKKVDKDGVVTVEESQSVGIESEVSLGLEFDKGYISPYMITNVERMEAVMNDPYILITDQKISGVKEILPLLESLVQSGKKDLVIIAEDVEGEALATFVVNKLRGGFNVLAVKAPGYGDHKKEILQDIAITVGAKVISEEVGLKLDKIELNMLGRAHRVISKKDSTVIVGGKGKKAEIEERVNQLKKQRENTESKFDIEKIEERIGKLSGGVAVIRVGASTETEMKYLKGKIEDAVNSTKAAIEEGIVAGGGSALIKVIKELKIRQKELQTKKSFDDPRPAEYMTGYSIVISALVEPLRQIAINAGKDDGLVIVDQVEKGEKNCGYDASSDTLVLDMFKAGIIDPVKVTRTALLNAASAVSILLTTNVAITDVQNEDKKENHSHSEEGMGY